MKKTSRRTFVAGVSAAAVIGGNRVAFSQKKYDDGASDTEIKIGNIMPYSGPASAYGVIGKTQEAYFRKVNAEGGINGRKINFITYDDAYSPPKTVEQTRKLVESDEVLFLFNVLGTAPNTAIQKYLNQCRLCNHLLHSYYHLHKQRRYHQDRKQMHLVGLILLHHWYCL